MGRTRQQLSLTLGLLLAVACSFSMAWGPSTLARGPADAGCDTAAATPVATGTPVASGFPAGLGLVVEEVLADTALRDANMAETAVRSRISLSCIEPDTPEMTLAQDYAATIIVVEGELEFRLAHACYQTALGTCLFGEDGVAYLYTTDDPATKQVLAVSDEWLTLGAGDVVVFANVMADIRTTPDSHARFISSGVAQSGAGDGCPCARIPP